jgi:hypothetical protein
MRKFLGAAFAGGLLMSVSGCLGLQARTPVAVPLVMPDPPSHVVMPPPIVEEPPPPAAPTTPARTPAPPPARPPVAPPVTSTPTTEPPPVLQTTANTSELEKRIQGQMDSANRDLSRVVRSSLPPDARDQYDWALAFLRQAREAVAIKNYNLAEQFSDKAARLASLLAKGHLTSPTSS